MSNPNIHVTQNVGEVKEGGTVIGVQVIYQGESVLIPSLEDVQLHRADLTKIHNYHRWADEFYIREEGKVLPLYASPYEDDSGRKQEDLLQTIRSHQRLLVLGEPGMGKTVAMERVMWETAQVSEPIVPIFVPLLYFQGSELIESIRSALNETRRLNFDNTKSVRAFLHETKCLILFDGLNEVPGQQREYVIGAIANFMREYPELRCMVTSRSQDELWRKLRASELIPDAVVVQNITDWQAQGYLEAHLGKKVGKALYDKLDNSLKALARTPLLLKLIKDAGQGSDQLPRNRGELFDKFVMNRLLERERKLEFVETAEMKKKALAHLAFALQLDHRLACNQEWAENLLVEKGLGNKAVSILSEALLHGLLLQQQNQPDQRLLRFMHQSVQEYFVALTLMSEVRMEKFGDPLHNVVRRLSRRNLKYWAKDSWWNESFVQLAGLIDDADWLARRIVNASPWLAWWCVEEGREVQAATRDLIETSSIKLLQSQSVAERRQAVQTLAQIKNERALVPLLIAAGDDNTEVAGLGVRALLDAGEAARPFIERALHGEDGLSWRACLRYLRNLASDPLWADVPEKMIEELLEASDKRILLSVMNNMSQDWVAQKIFYIAGDEDLSLANEAAQALVKWSEVILLTVRKSLQGDDRRSWSAALHYLGRQVDNPLWAEIPLQLWEEVFGQPMLWIPPGPFQMGSDKDKDPKAFDNELPRHSVTLQGYWIGRYPVTVRQWRVFVRESNYRADKHSLRDLDDHPVCSVSWGDAMAYCRWLSDKTGLPVTLASEAEWEKAARGKDARLYPWGDEFSTIKCNTYQSSIGTTTPVGKYSPKGDSPYGCADMSGNAWEWTRSKFKNYPYEPDDGREISGDREHRVVRGGSWSSIQEYARASFRNDFHPDYSSDKIGFRVVVRPFAL